MKKGDKGKKYPFKTKKDIRIEDNIIKGIRNLFKLKKGIRCQHN